jgi:hypothetical protein
MQVDDNEEDIESDELIDTSDDDDNDYDNNVDRCESEELDSVDERGSREGENEDAYDDDEEYENFLRSVFCDEEQNPDEEFGDDEEEEEYQPAKESDDDEDEDDDYVDDDLVQVAQRELVDLVDGCWQTCKENSFGTVAAV